MFRGEMIFTHNLLLSFYSSTMPYRLIHVVINGKFPLISWINYVYHRSFYLSIDSWAILYFGYKNQCSKKNMDASYLFDILICEHTYIPDQGPSIQITFLDKSGLFSIFLRNLSLYCFPELNKFVSTNNGQGFSFLFILTSC